MKAGAEPDAGGHGRGGGQDPDGHARIIPYAALFVLGLLVSGFTIRRGIGPFDEGLVLQAASRVADGQLPYRDFAWPYGPAQPLLLGALAEAFGQSLVWWRLERVAVDATIGVLVFALVRPHAPAWLAGVAWICAVAGFSQPTDPNPMAPAVAFGLAGVLVAARGGPAAAGALAGVAAAWRLDFGVYALVGVLAALALRGGFARALTGWVAAAAVAYLPFAVLAGPADLWEELVGRSLRDGAAWRLPFPLGYDGDLSSPADAKDLLDFYVPLMLVVSAGAAAAALWTRRPPAPAAIGLAGLALGGLAYLLSRTDEFHALPLLAIVAPLLALAWAPLRRRRAALVLPALLALLAVHGVANRASALLRPPELAPVHVPVADGVRAPAAEARAIEGMVAAVQRRVPRGKPIYSVTLRSDLVRINNPMVYVLAERPNALREDFGLNTPAAAQRRLAAALERAAPRVIVRWTDPASAVREPNRRGRPSGSRALDDWVAANYRTAERHGDYLVLERR